MRATSLAMLACATTLLFAFAPNAAAEPFGGCTYDTSGLGLAPAFAVADAVCAPPSGALCAVAILGDCLAP